MNSIKLTTCQAQSTEPIVSAVSRYLSSKLGISAEAVEDISWQERYVQVKDGRLDVGWICGSYYTQLSSGPDPVVELLAAPIMSHARYQGQPVYFSDVLVRKDSPFQTFDDLRGAAFAYNEPGSFSGYWSMRHHLARLGAFDGYFGRLVGSGGHVKSLQMILDGEVDTAAVDSMVFIAELQENPDLAANFRVVETLGPNPIPPWVVRRGLPEAQRSQLRQALLALHEDEDGRKLLEAHQMHGFSAVPDSFYDPIRQMIAKAAEVNWPI
ncbi:MAG: PhnD/SsuA/transferrin family substrate-binding protein [Candidatus Promineifilaceae bacterium]